MATSASSGTGFGIHTAQTASSVAPRALAGVFETLANQHRQVLELLRDAGAAQPAQRAERWAEARRRLLSHERAESTVVYEAIKGMRAAAVMLDAHESQAGELESAIRELDATDPSADNWIEQLRDVMAMLDDHVRDEEQDFFPRAQQLLGENVARELEEPFTAAQRDALHEL